MRRWPLLASALLIATGGAAGGLGSAAWAGTPSPAGVRALTAKASPHLVAGHKAFTAGAKQLIRLNPTAAPSTARMRTFAAPNLSTLPPTAKINVTYIGFSAPARAAFQAAVNIWETQIHSTVPIDVVADWSDLTTQYGDPSILGAAGPSTFVENFTNAPVQNVWYPIALANAIAGSDQLPANVCNSDWKFPDASGAEITASFNSAQSAWYFGTDGNPGLNQVDLESVVLHELGHGLGFVGSYDVPDVNGTGVGTLGLSGDGLNPTIFDAFAADGTGHSLETAYTSGTQALGDALRGADSGVTWTGAAGDAANATAGLGAKPILFSPGPFQEGSSFSHLDETTYSPGTGNALMTPQLSYHEVEHSVGSIVLGMFQDMGWPQTGSPAPTTLGDYHVAAPMRLVGQHVTTNTTPLTIGVAGVDGLPPAPGVKAVVVNVAVQAPTRAGNWATLPNCAGPQFPYDQNFQAGQTRTMQSVLPVDDHGRIEISLIASPALPISARVSVDLVGWYGNNGVSYHQLPATKQAFAKAVGTTPVDVQMQGVAGIPTSGVTAVVVSSAVGFQSTGGFILLGAGASNSLLPTAGYGTGEFTQNLAIVPLGTGAGAGKVRVRVSGGTALVVLNAIGWYGPSTAGGLSFHSAGPARLDKPYPFGQDVEVGGLPPSTPVMLDVHLANPSSNATVSAAPGGTTAFEPVQELKAGQNPSGTIIVMTSASGQVRLRLSSGTAYFVTDFEGWFAA